jgi:hypothetical protein
MDIELPVKILPQPDYTTCGPTSLHAVYSYFGDVLPLSQVIEEVHKLEGGGTLSVHLAVHALRRGYQADIWTCNVAVWDPTWFRKKTDLKAKFLARVKAKGLTQLARHVDAAAAVVEFFDRGGRLHWGDLTPELIQKPLAAGFPILTGTNGTYLYQASRESASGLDDVAGDPFGHFLVVRGYHPKSQTVSIADPLSDNPLHGKQYYRTTVHRLIGAIFLGDNSNDSNFLVLRPPRGARPAKAKARSRGAKKRAKARR